MPKQVEFTICNCGNPEGHVGPVWHPGQPIPEGVKVAEADLKQLLRGAVASANVRGAEIAGVVTRCGCGDPDSHSKLDPPQPCPKPRSTSDLGLIGYTHKSLLKRLHWRLVGLRQSTLRIRKANATS